MTSSASDTTEFTRCIVVDAVASDVPVFQFSGVVIQRLIPRRLLRGVVIWVNRRSGAAGKQPYQANCYDAAHISSPSFDRLHFRHNLRVSVH